MAKDIISARGLGRKTIQRWRAKKKRRIRGNKHIGAKSGNQLLGMEI
jgi:hypothetical protein